MIESIILTNLLDNEEYTRKVLPFVNLEYFADRSDKVIYESFIKYHEEYNSAPTRESLVVEISKDSEITEEEFDSIISRIETELVTETPPKYDWLIDKTEEWCKERAVYNAVMGAITIIDGDDEEERTPHAIPDLLKAALGVSFDANIGHDYIADAYERFEFYNEENRRTPFDIKLLNTITNGGVPDKTLNVILAGTNVGKTLAMIHFASNYLMQGKNVLYITLEMAEEMICNRIDANLMNLTVNEVENIEKSEFIKNIDKIKAATQGKLIVKEYPTASAHIGHFRHLLQELKLTQDFAPDVICIDYIGIAASSRVKLANTGSYFYIKAIAEEFRAFAVEHEVPIWTAVQVNRGGYSASDIDLTDTAESFGLPATADFMIGVVRTEELDEIGQLMVKQLKNRYANKTSFERFVIGVDPDRMLLYDVDNDGGGGAQGSSVSQQTIAPPNAPDKKSKFDGFT